MNRKLLLASLLSLAFALPALALSSGDRAPDIGLRDTNGRMVQMRALRGKVVLVDFWASWCEPCREEMPVLNRLQREYREQGLVVVGVNIDRDEANMTRFLRRTPVSFRVVHDSGGQTVAERFEPPRMPSSYLIDRRGVVRHVHEGFRASDASTLEEHVRALLAR